MKLRQITALLLTAFGIMAYGHDFEMPVDGGSLYFQIIDKAKKEVALTYCGNISDQNFSSAKGILEIPSVVINQKNGEKYKVTKIGSKAFKNAKELTGVIIPSSITEIGGFAFEKCEKLEKVIFPSRQPSFGSGVFFDCTGITTVKYGDDWTKINLSMFRWSEQLAKVEIPRTVTSITGYEKLKGLQEINVEELNKKYASVEGILYTANSDTLIFCPRNYNKPIGIAQGCKVVKNGALEACVNTESIVIPAGLTQISFHETYRMKNLSDIEIQSKKVFNTALMDGKEYFFFQLLNPKTIIYVDKNSKDNFIKKLPEDGGDFCEPGSDIPIMVNKNEIPTKSNFKNL